MALSDLCGQNPPVQRNSPHQANVPLFRSFWPLPVKAPNFPAPPKSQPASISNSAPDWKSTHWNHGF